MSNSDIQNVLFQSSQTDSHDLEQYSTEKVKFKFKL